MRREHRVPLSPRAVTLARTGLATPRQPAVFMNAATARPLSNMAMLELLRRMERPDLTVPGFRSTFRDWAAEMTDYPGKVAEAALAHVVGDKVEAAYRRGDLFEKRRAMMADWETGLKRLVVRR